MLFALMVKVFVVAVGGIKSCCLFCLILAHSSCNLDYELIYSSTRSVGVMYSLGWQCALPSSLMFVTVRNPRGITVLRLMLPCYFTSLGVSGLQG